MTVTYTADISTSRWLSNFLRLLFRWRGSIYKLVWLDLIIYMSIYLLIALLYREILSDYYRGWFEELVIFCNDATALIPLSFVLGFYVSIVMKRWWEQYTTIPWPDPVATLVSSSVQGFDDRARAMRRTIMRYVCLCQVIAFRLMSASVKKRFPTYNHIIDTGLLQENEKNIIEALDVAFPYYPKHWMPIVWAASIVIRARKENKIRDDYAVKSIIDELNRYRGLCGFLLYYDWVNVPLVYTQVVTLATYTYFLASVIGSQWTAKKDSRTCNNVVDKYFPILTILQFFFYMGWLKVAESLINPFGEDDDDFELNWMIDRNLTVSYMIVDEMHQEHPELVRDQYWDEVFPNELPYGATQRQAPPEHSTAKLVYSKPVISDKRENSMGFTGSSYSGSTSVDFPFCGYRMFNSYYKEKILRQRDSDDVQSANSLKLEELIEQRNRERHERLRHRFLKIQPGSSSSRRYIVTVLRPPTPHSSDLLISEGGEEEEHEKEPEADGPSKKPDKYE